MFAILRSREKSVNVNQMKPPADAPDKRPPARPSDQSSTLGADGEDHADGTIAIPIDGTLDLHTFRPDEVRELLPDYISECLARQIYELRIIHGKGRGILRAHVRKVLARDPRVTALRNADESAGSFGATLVSLQQPGSK